MDFDDLNSQFDLLMKAAGLVPLFASLYPRFSFLLL
jgi:hypothetical protein